MNRSLCRPWEHVLSRRRLLGTAATNPGSNGNGRLLKNGEYMGNSSPIHILAFEAA